MKSLDCLVKEIKACRVCEKFLEPHPVVSLHAESKIVLVSQAPGLKVHLSGIPWDDKSGDTLRNWLGVSKEEFYTPENFAILPMGFCYPGRGKSGDLPPRKECAPLWHEKALSEMKSVQLFVLIGHYAQHYYLKNKHDLTENVADFKHFLPRFFPLPHPSPRNFIWMNKNEWFLRDVVPSLRLKIREILGKQTIV